MSTKKHSEVPADAMVLVAVRFDADALSAIDAIIASEREKHPGRRIARPDIIREMVRAGLEKRKS